MVTAPVATRLIQSVGVLSTFAYLGIAYLIIALIAALIAGGVVALILLLRGGHDKPGTAAAPHTVTGTILAPGTPSVTAPHK